MPNTDVNLSDEQIRILRTMLDAKRGDLQRKTRANFQAATQADDQLAEAGDVAHRLTDIAETMGLAEHEQALLAEVEHALAKFAKGTYGLSESSGKPISFERLLAIPWARADAEEAEREERDRR